MPRGEHRAANLTPELRAKGARAANESRTRKRLEREAEAQQIWSDALKKAAQAYVDGLAAGTITVREVDNGGDPVEIIATDHDTRIKAADRITDRMLGRPVQRTELSGPDEGPIESKVDTAGVLAGLAELGLVVRSADGGTDAEDDEVHPSRSGRQ